MNSLALIYRDTKTLRFMKYLSATSKPFYQISCTYRPWSPPSDNPNLRHCDSDSDDQGSEAPPENSHLSDQDDDVEEIEEIIDLSP